MHAHSSCQVAEQPMIFGLLTCDTNAERGIGEAFLHNADEFYDVFGHREASYEEPRDPTDVFMQQQATGIRNSRVSYISYCFFYILLFYNIINHISTQLFRVRPV